MEQSYGWRMPNGNRVSNSLAIGGMQESMYVDVSLDDVGKLLSMLAFILHQN
jgi:hypothetical protein